MERLAAIRATLGSCRAVSPRLRRRSSRQFPDNALRRALTDVADYTVNRAR